MNTADVIIIGAGPGGYETAGRLAASGKDVVLIENREAGGTCLNRGCIPTKCLCHSAEHENSDFVAAAIRMREIVAGLRDSVDGLVGKCRRVNGTASITPEGNVAVGEEVYSAPKIIIATGSKPAMLPIPGAELALTSDDFLALDELPESVVVIGGGVIGLEFASILRGFGKEVTVVEYCKEVLPPFDREVAKRLRSLLSRRGIKFVTGAAVTSISEADGKKVVTYEGKKGPVAAEADMVLMAVGRKPVVPEGLAEAGIETDRRGFIVTDDSLQTTRPGIYAVGDCNGRMLLAHAASAQARVVEGMKVNLDVIPSAVFTTPEAAMVGLTNEQAEERGISCATNKCLFARSGKAQAMGEAEGFVKIVYDPETRRLLGCHIVGPHASDLIAEAALAVANGLTIDQVGTYTVHAHPTLAEIFAMACEV